MKPTLNPGLIVALLLGFVGCETAPTGSSVSSRESAGQSVATFSADVPASVTTPDVVETEKLGTLRFFDGMPDEATVQKVYDNLDFMRGVEAFLIGVPAASAYAAIEGVKAGGLAARGESSSY